MPRWTGICQDSRYSTDLMAALNFLSLQEFEALYSNKKPHYEYWFGEAIQKTMPTGLHGLLNTVLVLLLFRKGWKPSSEVRLKLSAFAHPVPDLIADRERIDPLYPTEPFDLCVEILSPGDNLYHTRQKAVQYLDWGIQTVWIIDPDRRKAYLMSLRAPSPIELSMTDYFTAGADSQALFTLQEVFEELDKLLG